MSMTVFTAEQRQRISAAVDDCRQRALSAGEAGELLADVLYRDCDFDLIDARETADALVQLCGLGREG